MEQKAKGHILALITIFIWGTTFISTKILLKTFTPIEILFYRFFLGFIFLILMYTKRLKLENKKEEIYFIFAGLSGVSLYYLFENTALTYTSASNVGVLVSVAPFFTAILSSIFIKSESLHKNFFIGFIIAISGIIFISFKDTANVSLSPMGDILALLAAMIWAVYSLLSKKISELGYNIIQCTRRIFFYGLIFMIIILPFFDFKFDISLFNNFTVIFNILFLGFGACSICFVTWNTAIKILGTIKTSAYIYIVPVITIITSFIVLKEKITLSIIIGTILVLIGLFLSERK